jgi:diguanylate cyclase (GGDEF)-like protein
MAENEIPQPQPQPDPRPQPNGGGGPDAASAGPAGAQPGEALAPDLSPQSPLADVVAQGGVIEQGFWHRRGAVGTLAALCVAAGAVGSLLGAHALAHTDSASASRAFPKSSAELASTLKLAIQHDEDLRISASTFFAANPKATAAQFQTWVRWAQALRRYPELQKLGFISLIRAPELTAFEARLTGGATLPASATSTLPAAGGASPGAPAVRSYFCLAAVELSRGPAAHSTPGTDQCASSSALLPSRDSSLSLYGSVAEGRGRGLVIESPVYRGNVPPTGFVSRRYAFEGWLREVLSPGVLLRGLLHGYPGYALRLRHGSPSAAALFTSGTPSSGAPSATVDLHDGWTLRTFGTAPASAGILSDSGALALLIAGVIASGLLGLLILMLGARPARPSAPRGGQSTGDDLYDPLTRLPNRALMLDRCEQMLARAGRQSGLLVGALFIDIDWFKDVNEKLGQGAGDQLLRIVAERLEGVIREHDSVGRLGGDEFVVLVESAARGVKLDSLARRVIEAMHKPVELDGFGPSFTLTASIGVAFGRYANPEDLLRDAHLALRAAQSAGRDRYTLFNANMRSAIEGRGEQETELNNALLERQFRLLYQPIHHLPSGKIVGLEALIRWQHPTQGEIAAESFMSLAEETGLIVPIGRWALEEACSRGAAWNVAGHRVGIWMKVAATQLNRDGFATDVRRALQQSGIEPSLLTLQIAETTVMRDVAAASERLEEVTRLGVRIAIDDFGSGYAHHADLQRMPVDFLKVDRSTLAASDDEDYRSWLLQAILVVGRDLSLPIVATQIETDEQMATLESMGCQMIQGNVKGPAVRAETVEGILASAPAESGPALLPPGTSAMGAFTPGVNPTQGLPPQGLTPDGFPPAGNPPPASL